LPEGWKRVRLGEVIKQSLSGDWGLNPKNSIDSYPVIGTLNFRDDGKINYESSVLRNIPKVKIEKIKLKKGDILLEKSGGSTDRPAGRVVYVDTDFSGTCSNFVQILQIKEYFDSKYIFYNFFWLYSIGLVNRYQQRTTGIINFKFQQYFDEEIPLPPLPEQQKIAEILETIDNAIEKTDAIIEKYKRIKQGLMQDLLTRGIDENGQIRSEQTHKFKDSPLGRISEEWEVVRLGEVAKISVSNVDKKNFEREKKVLFCNYLEVYQNEYIKKNLVFSIGTANSREIEKFRILKGDVIITKDSEEFDDIAISSYVSDQIYNLICGYHLAILRPSNINGLFLAKALRFPSVNIFFQNRANGMTRFGLTKETIETVLLPLPPLPEQQRTAEILSQVDETIEKEVQNKEKLERLKRGLMEDLLTGKVRVNSLINYKI
jgi:type I restriction enzyme S subunit